MRKIVSLHIIVTILLLLLVMLSPYDLFADNHLKYGAEAVETGDVIGGGVSYSRVESASSGKFR